MECDVDGRKCFTFLWELENANFCLQKKGEPIKSPAFLIEEIDRTKWKLSLYPRGARDGINIGFFLNREADSKGPGKVDIKYELSFVAKDGSILVSHGTYKQSFHKGGGFGYDAFHKREELFISKRSIFLPDNILRVRCRIWKGVKEMKKEVRCIGRTHIGVQRRLFLNEIINFNTLESDRAYTYQIKSMANDKPLLSIDLSFSEGLISGNIIHFELTLQDLTIKFATLQLFLIDAFGNKIECNDDEFWFEDCSKNKQITLFLTKKKLLEKESVYLPDGTLTLHWEMSFSKGVIFEEITEIEDVFSSMESEISDAQSINSTENVPLPDALKDNLKSLYDKQFLCDVKLKTKTSIFPAHKIILSASSPVFHAMFASDMREKNSDCVFITDLSDDAVRRMLFYIYTSRMEDVTLESVFVLYKAADKYEILALKNSCSSYLQNNLSLSNVCEVLLLADFHADSELKSEVLQYILDHDKEIINSDEWSELMEVNGKLACETMCLLYQTRF